MSDVVVVTGATGQQGGAVARRLLAAGVPVRALVRRPESEAAKAIAAAGAELVTADLTDPASLGPALRGARAVFSVQTPDLADLSSDTEWIQGENLVAAAREAGVAQYVHSSVAGVGDYVRQAAMGRAAEWSTHYWGSKSRVGQLLPESGFESWTELRPAFFMENLVRPSIWFEGMTGESIVTVVSAQSRLPLIAVQDVGTAAAAAFADPVRFNGIALDLAGDIRTLPELAAILTAAGAPARVEVVAADEAKTRGMMPELIDNQERLNTYQNPAHPALAAALGIPTTTFETWASKRFAARSR
ncbi:SDR family oxidoreductase [Kribbella sp. CA-293567]|uniref:SDR family oxidoreductase n=1 Tax=Kribbella sp. CA-293567 TaxID=3002436 RepID=UPI0022DD45D5|nr:NmrA family NAD(P)-binding protein [Kribbella sp. CA-293567]WBQ03735.1 NmrA family NAD(P)-binding protein [Kribbella sp. CA-293567]